MPSDKSPWPDGFNGHFMKNYWNVIKGQFYKLCSDFYDGKLQLQSINTTFIALIPKIENPECSSYYKPISLISMDLKMLTKLLANRLQKVIIPLVHPNQYGFIKNRNIQDCLAWSLLSTWTFVKSQKRNYNSQNWFWESIWQSWIWCYYFHDGALGLWWQIYWMGKINSLIYLHISHS